MKKITDAIQKVKNVWPFSTRIDFVDFLDRASINKSATGIYIITEGQDVLYVGKGHIAARHERHLQKIQGLSKVEPRGWVWLRTVRQSRPENWKMIMVFTESRSVESLLEGALIHELQPLVNDEIFGKPVK
jgi:hypothetical protein